MVTIQRLAFDCHSCHSPEANDIHLKKVCVHLVCFVIQKSCACRLLVDVMLQLSADEFAFTVDDNVVQKPASSHLQLLVSYCKATSDSSPVICRWMVMLMWT